MRFYVLMVTLAVLAISSVGCTSGRQPIQGSADYSLSGKVISPPNQVRVENPYSFGVAVSWQDEEIKLPAHSSRLILFKGMNKPGPIRIHELDQNGNKLAKELTYEPLHASPFRQGLVYQIR